MESLKNKTILVIGGTGFIGQHLIEKLQSLNSEVISVSLGNNNEEADNQHPDATYFSADISDANALKKMLIEKGCGANDLKALALILPLILEHLLMSFECHHYILQYFFHHLQYG